MSTLTFSSVYKNSLVHDFTLRIPSHCIEKLFYIELIDGELFSIREKLQRYKTLAVVPFLHLKLHVLCFRGCCGSVFVS
jgi:hypothetical protein